MYPSSERRFLESSRFFSENPEITLLALILGVFVYYLLGKLDKKIPPENIKLNSFTTVRSSSLNAYYQLFFAEKNVPFHLVETILQVFYYDLYYDQIHGRYQKPIESTNLLSPHFIWKFTTTDAYSMDILNSLETEFDIQISLKEAENLHSIKDFVDFITPKLKKPISILFVCTQNSSHSMFAEALTNYLGKGRFCAFSLINQPTDMINPNALVTLERNGLPFVGYQTLSRDEFANTPVDIVITVGGKVAQETYPAAYLDNSTHVHWELPDPALVTGSEEDIEKAFQATYEALSMLIKQMVTMPIENMTSVEISRALTRIGIEL